MKEIAHKAARYFHTGQVRKYTGEPYIRHPERVAQLVEEVCKGDTAMICAAYLHDVMEDCGVAYMQLQQVFGTAVASMVVGLTKVKYRGVSRAEWKQKELERLQKCSWEVKAIKLMDICDNLRDIELADLKYAEMYFGEQKRLAMNLMLDEALDFSIVIYVWKVLWEASSKITAMKAKEVVF